ncbi:MAG: carbamoyl-phosphate synthase large subunit [Vicinamibacteria bacterium]
MRDQSIKSVLVIGSGPIVIGQACEFDYSGTQAIKVLKREGIRVILVNSNPATIMTDPEYADATYIEPLTPEFVEKILEKERPDAILPTVGGQTALNLAIALAKRGTLERLGIRLIGASRRAVEVGEDRQLFKEAMARIGLDVPRSAVVKSMEEAKAAVKVTGMPAIIRPSFTMGGSGGGIARTEAEFEDIVTRGLMMSPVHEVLIEESILGWKEYELEVMRDQADNFVVICSIENFDPMGVHTGDSITVAPAQTLSDPEYQRMRNAARDIIREVGVETGGSNIQFATNPKDGRLIVIEMNPRVSRSSALASKATGFPIAKIAALLAIGYTLDEITNDITKVTPASFEPTIDYVVVKIPRFAFEKFPGASSTLGTQMKSVGEVMAIGGTFKEAFQKGLRGLEIGANGFFLKGISDSGLTGDALDAEMARPSPDRLFHVRAAFDQGRSIANIYAVTAIDPWFLDQLQQIVDAERAIVREGLPSTPKAWFQTKQLGFSDARLGDLVGKTEAQVRTARKAAGIVPVYKRVDTCAAEFESHTPYMYSTYETECEADPTTKRKVMILGSGPNRIGQGIEFDYCCCHASFAFQEEGCETLMVNCNPETVSTDYDTSDRLYFEPLTFEDVMNIVEREKPDGVVIQFGGQTPLKLALPLFKAGVPIWGTTPDMIDLAEDRKRFAKLLDELNIPQPESGTASSIPEAAEVARRIGYPVLVRPSYVLGGRAMAIVYSADDLEAYAREAVKASPDHPILVDRFLEDAFEVDVDALGDGERVIIGGILEHIEEAGIHSGDSAMVLPTYKVKAEHITTIRDYTRRLGLALNVRGLMNVQYAIKDDKVYVIEVNPRASRTTPFISKATGVPMAKVAAKIAAGRTLEQLGLIADLEVRRVFVKESVLPFVKFQGSDILLGPEMKSTGEVMGIARGVGVAFAKAQAAAGTSIPTTGSVFISVHDRDKAEVLEMARFLHLSGFKILATSGTAAFLEKGGVPAQRVDKVGEGKPDCVDLIRGGQIQLVINTPLGRKSFVDDGAIRKQATQQGILALTTLTAAAATVDAVRALRTEGFEVESLQEILA